MSTETRCIRFNIRCILCAQEYQLSGFFRSHGVWASETNTTLSCRQEGCTQSRLPQALYCPIHVLLHTVGAHPRSWAQEHTDSVKSQILPTRKWNIDSSSNFGWFLKRERSPQGPRFFALDLEGLISGSQPTVWQAAAVDVESLTKDATDVLFNLNLVDTQQTQQPANHLRSQVPGDFNGALLRFGNEYFWTANKARLSGTPATTQEAAAMIKASGLRPSDFIVVWHKQYADVSALRYLLSQVGLHGVMPPNDHIIRLNYLFRRNLIIPHGANCSLEFLFNAFFPSHPLRHDHHDALIDSKKAALMALLAEKLCRGEDTTQLQGIGIPPASFDRGIPFL